MLEIKETIKRHKITCMKNKDSVGKNVLTTLLGEIERFEKGGSGIDESKVISIIKKMVVSNKETIELTSNEDQKKVLEAENIVLSEYLPTQMSEETLKLAIQTFIDENPSEANIGSIMKHLKLQYSGQYDGKMASSLARQAV